MSLPKELRFSVPPEAEGRRLDSFVSERCPDLSRARVKRLVEAGGITVDGRSRKASFALRTGMEVAVSVPKPEPSVLRPEPIPLDIVYEDRYLLVVNKPAGMTVHPAAGARTGTLVHALLYHCTDLSGIGGVLRPGIVHRLDKGTSGLLVVAKSDSVHKALAGQIQARELGRVYKAVVWGGPQEDEGVVDAPVARHPTVRKKMAVTAVGGKPAVTHFKVLRRFKFASLLELALETGRTHQVRTHMAFLGCPVFGDPEYGGRRKALNAFTRQAVRREAAVVLKGIDRQALHAWRLSLIHPERGERMTFTAAPPDDFDWVLEKLLESAAD